MRYTGTAGVLWKALVAQGISPHQCCAIYQHINKRKGLRRVKVWRGDAIHKLTDTQFAALMQDIRTAYDTRFHSAEFIDASTYHWDWSFVVWLHT